MPTEKVTFYMKSGNAITVNTTGCSWKYSGTNITSLELTCVGRSINHIDVPQIEAIVTEEPTDD